MPPLHLTLLAMIMADETPPGVPRAVVKQARYLGHLIPCARGLAVIAAVGGPLFHIEGSAHAVRINARWLLTFDWDAAFCRAHSLSLDKI